MKLTDNEKDDLRTASEVYRQAHQLIRQGNILLDRLGLSEKKIDEFSTTVLSNVLSGMLTKDKITKP